MTRPAVPAFAARPVVSVAVAVGLVLTALSGRYGSIATSCTSWSPATD
ncbi:hypothetical protein [Kribbella sp. NBC_00359]